MPNPVLVEVIRGGVIESRHRGAIAIVDGEGKLVSAIGDVGRAVFPRSAIKALQALPLVESGAADHFNLTPQELALACSSHSGEAGHIETARSILEKIGLDESALECGCQRPSNIDASLTLAKNGVLPTNIHNNCSGKHSGFLCLACHGGINPTGYIDGSHTIQKEIKSVMEAMTGAAHAEDHCGIDGCSIPTYAVTLKSIAHGFARFVTGIGLSSSRESAAQRIYKACVDYPWYVAGTDRACTCIMAAGKGRVFVKTGAEGMFCAAIPELGVGIAIKCDDGTSRAAECIAAATIANLLPVSDQVAMEIREIGQPTLKNWNGLKVGEVAAASTLKMID